MPSSIDKFSIVTLVFFILSIFFVIRPVSFNVPLPRGKNFRITLGLLTAPVFAVAILWASQCLGPVQIRAGIVGTGIAALLSSSILSLFFSPTDGIKPYNILILFFSLAYQAISLDVTGILQAAAFWVINKGGNNLRKLYFYFYLLLTTISMVIGNDPVILSGTVFLAEYTKTTKLLPTAWLIAEFAAANTASMVLFVGNPTNVVVCEGFRINNAAFTAYTILPFLACSVACYGALLVQFRGHHIPRSIRPPEKLNVKEALIDPGSALFGTISLITCLILVIVLSFLHVDVWKITLPFAVAKFIFDLLWDNHRFKTGKLNKNTEIPLEDQLGKQLQRAFSMDRDIVIEDVLQCNDTPTKSPGSNGIAKPGESPTVERTQNGSTFFPFVTDLIGTCDKLLKRRFPTFSKALPRLPFALVPFAFSQFILIEGLSHQGWIDLFAKWLIKATKGQMFPTVWLVGVLGIILCNVAGTNIGATILLTKVVRAASLPSNTERAAGLALAIASNIGAVSFTFCASLAGLLWKSILNQKKIDMKQTSFAKWNSLLILVMTAVGLGVVTAEVAVLYL